MHLWWDPDAPTNAMTAVTNVEATLEVIEPPSVDRLYFWALQATFIDTRGRPVAGAHLGLQWHGAHPGGTAVNWGGYRNDGSGRELDGDPSPLPSATGNANTRDFRWRPHTPYRLRIDVDGTGSVTDLSTTERTVVRRLHVAGAQALANAVVWSEVFADCDDPPTAVRWSDLEPRPRSARVTYQSFADGGCTNTENGFTQRTSTRRSTPEGPHPMAE